MCNPFCKNYFDRKFTISPPPGRRLRDPGNSRRCRKLLQLVEAFRSLRSFPVIQAQLQGLLRAASAVSQREGLRVAGTATAVWVSGLSDRPTPLSLRLPHRRGVLPTTQSHGTRTKWQHRGRCPPMWSHHGVGAWVEAPGPGPRWLLVPASRGPWAT